MKIQNQTNRILGKDWVAYHPYSDTTFVDNYYISLCNKVLKIISQSELAAFLKDAKEEKMLACILTAYFEDVISETRLFSTFTRLHKKMYGKALPFYEITDDYYDDEINLRDIYFLIWYHACVQDKEMVYDPYFENDASFNEAVTEIYNLFDSEFEKAPQNEKLQNFLILPVGSSATAVREKLTFIAQKSFLWKAVYDMFFEEVLSEYKKNDTIVLDDIGQKGIYDQQIYFIFSECLPLLSLRANEYYAAILGEEHAEYQLIKNISKRIFGSFLLLKIENNGYLIEHYASGKKLFLSDEFTVFNNKHLIENESVLSLSLVHWNEDIWHMQGACLVNKLHELNAEDIKDHAFEDDKKKDFLVNFEKVFLEQTNGKRLVYMQGRKAFVEFYIKCFREYNKMIDPEITDKELEEKYKNYEENRYNNLPFEKDEAVAVFFNPNSGVEIFRERIVACMCDKNNPYYANQEFDINDLLTIKSLSKEFVYYAIENDIIKLCIQEYANPDMFHLIRENFDFLLRFFRRSDYFSKPSVSI